MFSGDPHSAAAAGFAEGRRSRGTCLAAPAEVGAVDAWRGLGPTWTSSRTVGPPEDPGGRWGRGSEKTGAGQRPQVPAEAGLPEPGWRQVLGGDPLSEASGRLSPLRRRQGTGEFGSEAKEMGANGTLKERLCGARDTGASSAPCHQHGGK